MPKLDPETVRRAARWECAYARHSGTTVDHLRSQGQVVVACMCDSLICDGLASVSRALAEDCGWAILVPSHQGDVVPDPLTQKQRQIVDYMRGNGCRLTPCGRDALKRRGVWTARGISLVVTALVRQGLATPPGMSYTRANPAGELLVYLTEEGRRV